MIRQFTKIFMVTLRSLTHSLQLVQKYAVVAGKAGAVASGDEGLATPAQLNYPGQIVQGSDSALDIADFGIV